MILGRVDRARALAQLEMELRLIDLTGATGLGDDLTAADLIAALDQDLVIVGVGRHPIVRMPDQHEIAVAFQLVAGIGDDAVLRRLHRGAERNGDVDAVIVAAVGLGAEL